MNNNIEIMDFEDNNKNNNMKFSVVETYGEDLTAKKFITNPAIARDDEIKKMMIVLMTPEKSALLIGKPGIGKTAIVEGLSYLIQQNKVPDALKGYRILKFNSTSLVGTININGEEQMIMSLFVSEIKKLQKTGEFNKLNANLKEIAKLRLENPDMSLTDLGKILKEPIGKSGVNYRLKKIIELAK